LAAYAVHARARLVIDVEDEGARYSRRCRCHGSPLAWRGDEARCTVDGAVLLTWDVIDTHSGEIIASAPPVRGDGWRHHRPAPAA
jgi:hypothetical protein